MNRVRASKVGFAFLMASLVLFCLFFLSTRGWIPTVYFPTDSGFTIGVHAGAFQFGTGYRSLLRLNDDGAEMRVFDIPPTSLGRISLAPYWSSDSICRYFSIPIWMLLLPSTVTSWFFYRRARRKHLIGHCSNCSYNLTGNVSGICPECGERI